MKFSRKMIFMVALLMVSILTLSACDFFSSQLSTPKNLEIVETTLTWGEVENAVSYKVSIDGDEKDAPEATYSLADLTEPGDYSIKVKAVGGDNYRDSAWSKAKTYTIEGESPAFDFKDLDSIREAMEAGNFTTTILQKVEMPGLSEEVIEIDTKTVLRLTDTAFSGEEYFDDELVYSEIFVKDGNDYYRYYSYGQDWYKNESDEEEYAESTEGSEVYFLLFNNDYYDFDDETETYSIKEESFSDMQELMDMPDGYELLSLTITYEDEQIIVNFSFSDDEDEVFSSTMCFSDIGTTEITIPETEEDEIPEFDLIDFDGIYNALSAGNFTLLSYADGEIFIYNATPTALSIKNYWGVDVDFHSEPIEEYFHSAELYVKDGIDYYSYSSYSEEWQAIEADEYTEERQSLNDVKNIFNSIYYDFDENTGIYSLKDESLSTVGVLLNTHLLSLTISCVNEEIIIEISYLYYDEYVLYTTWYISDIGTTAVNFPAEYPGTL